MIYSFDDDARVATRIQIQIGTTHDRPTCLALNRQLVSLGSVWRTTTAKSVGLHLYHPGTHECRLPNAEGWVTIPDLSEYKLQTCSH